jgi:G3E family GTPase
MRTPTVVVTGVEPTAIDSAMVSLSWDLPRAVAVRHRIDPHSQVLTRTVSHAEGLLEQEQIPLEHACVSCALREDILPTLERLARDGRWDSIVAGLPVATEAVQLAHVLTRDSRLARHLKLSNVVTAVNAGPVAEDLLGDDLLRERNLHSNPDDERGVAEVGCAQVEFADVILLSGEPNAGGVDLVSALARPDAELVLGADRLQGEAMLEQRHRLRATQSWASPVPEIDVPPLSESQAWRLELTSPRPFHPERLLDRIEQLGGGRHRSRGCFWVPTRPGTELEWCGAGGQLSIGSHAAWERRTPMTRLLLTGLGPTPSHLVEAFEDLLLTPEEARQDLRGWKVLEDGLEPWLGDIRDVA